MLHHRQVTWAGGDGDAFRGLHNFREYIRGQLDDLKARVDEWALVEEERCCFSGAPTASETPPAFRDFGHCSLPIDTPTMDREAEVVGPLQVRHCGTDRPPWAGSPQLRFLPPNRSTTIGGSRSSSLMWRALTSPISLERVGDCNSTPNNSKSSGLRLSALPAGILPSVLASRVEQGVSASTARSGCGIVRRFVGEWMTGLAIVLNAITIGLSAEVHPKWGGWAMVDGGFAVFFGVEIATRMWSLGLREFFFGSEGCCNLCRDVELRWRIFELLLVLFGLGEFVLSLSVPGRPPGSTGFNFNMLRTLRLTRIARLIRVCRLKIFSELVMMINGAIGGMRTLLCSVMVIALPLYAVSLLMHESLAGLAEAGNGADAFSSLTRSWFTMFRCTIAGDCSNSEGRPIFLLVTDKFGWIYGVVFCASTSVMTFGLFNVVAAIFVENTLAAAKFNSIMQKRQRLLDTNMFRYKVAELVRFIWCVHMHMTEEPERFEPGAIVAECEIDLTRNMSQREVDEAAFLQITPDFFRLLSTLRGFQALLEELDVSDEDKVDLFDTLDVDGGGTIDLEEMVVGIAKLRGEARRSDVVGVGLVTRSIQADIRRIEERLAAALAMVPGSQSTSCVMGAAVAERRSTK